MTASHVARAFLEFEPSMTDRDRKDLEALNEEGFREYRYASRWLLGDRDLKNAKPLERLWAGINNCSGQMLLPPLAAAHAGNPEAAYRMAFDVDFIDAPLARDIAAALVASLAAVLGATIRVPAVCANAMRYFSRRCARRTLSGTLKFRLQDDHYTSGWTWLTNWFAGRTEVQKPCTDCWRTMARRFIGGTHISL